jgi:hypothetical protein
LFLLAQSALLISDTSCSSEEITALGGMFPSGLGSFHSIKWGFALGIYEIISKEIILLNQGLGLIYQLFYGDQQNGL